MTSTASTKFCDLRVRVHKTEVKRQFDSVGAAMEACQSDSNHHPAAGTLWSHTEVNDQSTVKRRSLWKADEVTLPARPVTTTICDRYA